MNRELAEHISLMAAPLYAMFIGQQRRQIDAGGIDADTLSFLRHHAIQQAHALWLDMLDYSAS